MCRFLLFLERDKIHKVLLLDMSDFRCAIEKFVWLLWTVLLSSNPHQPSIPTFGEWWAQWDFSNSMFNKRLEGDRDEQILDTFKMHFLKVAMQLELGIKVAGSSRMPLGAFVCTNTES